MTEKNTLYIKKVGDMYHFQLGNVNGITTQEHITELEHYQWTHTGYVVWQTED
jgi:hypothetical protein